MVALVVEQDWKALQTQQISHCRYAQLSNWTVVTCISQVSIIIIIIIIIIIQQFIRRRNM